MMNHGEGYRLFPEDNGRFDSVSLPREARMSKANFVVVPTTLTASEQHSAMERGVLEPLKSSTNTTSGDSMLQSRTRIIELPASTMQTRLLVLT